MVAPSTPPSTESLHAGATWRCPGDLGRRYGAFTVEVAFKRPILLPSTVEHVEARDGDQIRFGARDAKRSTPHLDGLVSF